MRLVLPWSVKAGKRYKIVQKYWPSGTTVTYEGVASMDGDRDEYVCLRNTSKINCHSHVGMDVEVWEV